MSLAVRIYALSLVSLVASPLAAQFQVWTVDDDGSADYSDLQAAIDGASEGDALLVSEGTYSLVEISAKRLTLIGADSGLVTLATPAFGEVNGLVARNLNDAQPLLIVNMDLRAHGDFFGVAGNAYGVEARECAGVVWVQSSRIVGDGGGLSANQATLVIRDCTAEGERTHGPGSSGDPRPGDGATLESSDFLAYGSFLTGAMGANAGCIIGISCGATSFGGDGVRVATGSTAHLFNVDSAGGHGEESICEPMVSWGYAGSGGDGIHIEAGSNATALNSTFAAGAAGQSFNVCPSGDPGNVQSGAGSLDTSTYVSRKLSVTDLVREGEMIELSIEGLPGENVLLGLAVVPSLIEDSQIEGPLVLGNLLAVVPVGAVPASGNLQLQFQASNLPPGFEFFTYYLQPVLITQTGARKAADPMAIVILDSAY